MGHDQRSQAAGQAVTAAPLLDGPRRVRVWLGEHPIIDYPALAATKAAAFEAALKAQFRSHRVTNDPDPGPDERPAPTSVRQGAVVT
ncbi:hypothetical protein ACFV9C_43975 [Kribbella sp. NPDC059898]|uniref:hypothetical protein n=1 Tax=Kribbella sp. NPDC059898 TaxID=3346995 RepID=UPI0036659E43